MGPKGPSASGPRCRERTPAGIEESCLKVAGCVTARSSGPCLSRRGSPVARPGQISSRCGWHPAPPPRMWLNKVLPQFSSKKRIPDAESGPCSAENNRGGIRSHAVLILAPEFFFKASSSSPRVVSCSCRHLRVSARPRRIYKRSPTLEEQRLLRKVTGNRRCERRASLEIVSAARPPLNSRSPTAGSDLGIARCPAQPGPRTPEAPLHPL